VKIDVAEFVKLTALLALTGCASGKPTPSTGGSDDSNVIVAEAPSEPKEAPVTIVPASEDAGPAVEAPPPSGPPPMAEVVPAPEARLAACDRLSPACEGLVESCAALTRGADPSVEGSWGHGFAKPVAEQIASCWAAKVKAPACDYKVMGRCVKDAVMKAKVDRSLDASCTQVMADCKRIGKPAKYTKDQCLHILSSTSGPARTEAARMMGPMGEGCTLDYAVPYSAFGP